MKTPVKIAITAMIANMVFNGILFWPFKHAGIALATSLSSLLNMGCLFYFLRKKGFYAPREGWKLFSLRMFVANAALGIGLWFGAGDLNDWLTHDAVWRVTHLVILAVSALVIYFGSLWLSGVRPRDILISHQQTEPS